MLGPAGDLGFVLYGGTAVAVRLGHRVSYDFDLFSAHAIDRDALVGRMRFLAEARIVFEDPRSLRFQWMSGPSGDPVTLSFIGGIGFVARGTYDRAVDTGLPVASLRDLLATKLKVILERAEAKDYRDIAAILRSGVSLDEGLQAAQDFFARDLSIASVVKALAYFDDGDLRELSASDRHTLVTAAMHLGPVARSGLPGHEPHLR